MRYVEPLSRYRLVGEWAEWLSAFPWTHFETLTFKEPRSSPRSVIGSLKRHRSRLKRMGIQSRCFAVVEGSESVRLHLHTLSVLRWTGPRAHLSAHGLLSEPVHFAADRAWREHYGRARIRRLGSDRTGAAFYVAKYLLKEDHPRWWFLPETGWDRIIEA